MLYWFRTPPGVKVGRAALDEEAIRLIEQLNPGMEFDWTRILKGQGAPPTETRPPVETRRQRPDNRRQQPSQSPARQNTVPAPAPVRDLPSETARTTDETSLGGSAFSPTPSAETPPVAAEHELELEPAVQPAVHPTVPGPAEESARDVVANGALTPAHAKLGTDGVERLRARYAELLVRISERTPDPLRREELKWQADRLNPDAWVTSEDVVQGLEQYESVFASLREVVGQKRRRRRRGSQPRQAEAGGAAGPGEDAPDTPEPPDSPEGTEDGGDSSAGES